jgi:hypothetical protein
MVGGRDFEPLAGPTETATVSAGSPGPVATSSTEWPAATDASSMRACATGANIWRMGSRYFVPEERNPTSAFEIGFLRRHYLLAVTGASHRNLCRKVSMRPRV